MLTALVSKKILITGNALRLKGTNVHSVREGRNVCGNNGRNLRPFPSPPCGSDDVTDVLCSDRSGGTDNNLLNNLP